MPLSASRELVTLESEDPQKGQRIYLYTFLYYFENFLRILYNVLLSSKSTIPCSLYCKRRKLGKSMENKVKLVGMSPCDPKAEGG